MMAKARKSFSRFGDPIPINCSSDFHSELWQNHGSIEIFTEFTRPLGNFSGILLSYCLLTRGIEGFALTELPFIRGPFMRAWAIGIVLVTGQLALAEPDKLPKPLPDEVTKAWKDAGATVGWMKTEDSGLLAFIDKPEAGAIPAFRFAKWKDGILPKLRLPEAPFGLDLGKTEITDTGLKELAQLKSLTSLTLCETMVTDIAVEALRKALPKCFVFHC
jgi:hypothetical protein